MKWDDNKGGSKTCVTSVIHNSKIKHFPLPPPEINFQTFGHQKFTFLLELCHLGSSYWDICLFTLDTNLKHVFWNDKCGPTFSSLTGSKYDSYRFWSAVFPQNMLGDPQLRWPHAIISPPWPVYDMADILRCRVDQRVCRLVQFKIVYILK